MTNATTPGQPSWFSRAPLQQMPGSVGGHLYGGPYGWGECRNRWRLAVLALVSAGVAWRARGDSNRSATAAELAEHGLRGRGCLSSRGRSSARRHGCHLPRHNLDGPDLVSVVVHRPEVGTADGGGVVYPVAATAVANFADSAEIGPIPLAHYGRFTFKFGSRDQLPESASRSPVAPPTGCPGRWRNVDNAPRAGAATGRTRTATTRGAGAAGT